MTFVMLLTKPGEWRGRVDNYAFNSSAKCERHSEYDKFWTKEQMEHHIVHIYANINHFTQCIMNVGMRISVWL